MTVFQVALLQMISGKSQSDNLKKGLAFCRRAKEMGADIALFPEMWNTGYCIADDVDERSQSAITMDSLYINEFKNLAKELNMAIAITYLEKHAPHPRNTVSVIDRFGNIILTYSKVHTCDFGEERVLSAGDAFYVADLKTKSGTVKIGTMICYDREFPESARILMLKGAEIILVPNACPMEINRLSQLRTRAFENMIGIATANYACGQPDCNGHSSAYDGIAYGDIGGGTEASRDTLIIEAGEMEGVYLATFPMDKIRTYRESEVHGNAYRHPEKYHLLISEEIDHPFKRNDYRR